MSQYTSFYKFISEEQRDHPFNGGKLTGLLLEVLSACKKIAYLTGRGQLASQAVGAAESENVQGEQQKKLDILSNELFIESTQWCGYLAGMASEEMDHSLPVPDIYPRGKYLITFDPLDGSSNIDINVSVGTIFSILEVPEGVTVPADGDFLQAGVKQVCAGYCLYGTSTMLVLTTGRGVNGFTLDPGTGDFYLTMPNIKLPTDTNEYSINQSYSRHWEPPVQRYISECLDGEDGPLKKNYNMRWVASMVADVHRLLCRGGIFMYPMDARMQASGVQGKLRLLYEANPMSFIVEQAGGVASTGRERIMEIQPDSLHQRVPVIMGSKTEVERVVGYHDEENDFGRRAVLGG